MVDDRLSAGHIVVKHGPRIRVHDRHAPRRQERLLDDAPRAVWQQLRLLRRYGDKLGVESYQGPWAGHCPWVQHCLGRVSLREGGAGLRERRDGA